VPGGVGRFLAVFGIVLGALAATNSLIFSSSRVSFAMGRDGTLPKALGRLHPTKRTPHVSIAASGLLILLMTLTLEINTVAASAGIMFLLLFVMVNWSAIVLRRTMPDVKRYYKMPFFPWPPVLGIVGTAVVALSVWQIDALAWLIALGWIGLGLLIHTLYERKEVVAGVTRMVESILPTPRERYQILVPIEDFERPEIVDFAALVAKVEDAVLTLLHIIEVPETLPIDAIDRLYVSEVRWGLGKLRRRAEDLGVTARARVEVSHRVSEAILENIKEDETDLLVLGWKGGWRKGRILGSNVDRFVQEAPCDVVVFKSAGLKDRLERVLVLCPSASWAFDRLKLAFNSGARWQELFSLYDVRLAAGLEKPYALKGVVVSVDRAGGKVTITTRPGVSGSGTPDVVLLVHDDGAPIPPEGLDQIFEPFHTRTTTGDGNLWLATARGILVQSGGSIRAESGPDGTTFTVRLPAVASIAPSIAPRTVEPLPHGTEWVLVVDDEDGVRDFIERALTRLGYHVTAVSSGEAALERVRGYFAEPIDLLITDVVLPGMSGPELATALGTSRPAMPVLYISGYASDVTAFHGLPGLAAHVLAKPFGMDTLVRRVRTIFDERAARTDVPAPTPGTRWELEGQPRAEHEAQPGA